MLQGQPLGLGDDEEGKQQAQEERTTPDEEHLNRQVALVLVHDVWRDDGNHTVPQPVRGCSKSNTLGSNWERVDLANHDPGSRTPGGCKGGDVQASENDEADLPMI